MRRLSERVAPDDAVVEHDDWLTVGRGDPRVAGGDDQTLVFRLDELHARDLAEDREDLAGAFFLAFGDQVEGGTEHSAAIWHRAIIRAEVVLKGRNPGYRVGTVVGNMMITRLSQIAMSWFVVATREIGRQKAVAAGRDFRGHDEAANRSGGESRNASDIDLTGSCDEQPITEDRGAGRQGRTIDRIGDHRRQLGRSHADRVTHTHAPRCDRSAGTIVEFEGLRSCCRTTFRNREGLAIHQRSGSTGDNHLQPNRRRSCKT